MNKILTSVVLISLLPVAIYAIVVTMDQELQQVHHLVFTKKKQSTVTQQMMMEIATEVKTLIQLIGMVQ